MDFSRLTPFASCLITLWISKLTEEEKLIKDTAAQFVDKELIAREGDYLRQQAPFLPPGAPAKRDLDPQVQKELTRARAPGWLVDIGVAAEFWWIANQRRRSCIDSS